MLPVLLFGGIVGVLIAVSRASKASAAAAPSDEVLLQKTATAAKKKQAATKKTVAAIRSIEASFPTAPTTPTKVEIAKKYDPAKGGSPFQAYKVTGDEDPRHL